MSAAVSITDRPSQQLLPGIADAGFIVESKSGDLLGYRTHIEDALQLARAESHDGTVRIFVYRRFDRSLMAMFGHVGLRMPRSVQPQIKPVRPVVFA